MSIAQTGVNLRFTADTAAAAAQMAALERRLESLQNKMGKKIKQAAFDTSGFDVRVNSQVRVMDDLTKSIQRGNISYRQFADTLKGTNGLMEYQSRLARSHATSMRALGNGQMMVGMDVRNVRGVNSALADQAVRLSAANAATKAYGQSVMNLGKNMAFMGRQAMLSVTAPLLLVSGGSAAVFYQYDKQLTTIVKLAGDSSSAFQASSSTIRAESMALSEQISNDFGVTIKDSLKVMETFSALGKSGQDLATATKSASRLMKLGDLDPESAIKFTNTMQTVFGKTNEQLEDSINLINEMENSTVLSMNDVADAMPKIGPVVKAMGGDIDQVLVLLEALKRGGIDAVEGANAVKAITGSVFRSTKKLRGMYAEMVPGDQWETMIARNGNNIVKIIGDIGNKMNKLSTADRMKFMYQLGGKEQAARLLQLTSNLAAGNDQVNKVLMKSNEDRKKIADKEIADLMASASTQFDVQIQRIMAIASSIGAKVLPMVTNGMRGLLDALSGIGERVGKTMAALGPFGDMLKGIGKLSLFIAGAFGPALLVISAGALIIGGMLKLMAKGIAMAARGANLMSGGRFVLPAFQTAQQKAERDARSMAQAQKAQVMSAKELQAAIDRLTVAYTGLGAAATGAAARGTAAAATQRATATQLATNPALMPSRSIVPVGTAGLRSDAARQRMNNSTASINRLNSQVNLVGRGPSITSSASPTHTVGAGASAAAQAQMEKNAATAQKLGTAVGGAAIAFSLLGTMMAGSNAEAQKWVMIIGGSLLVMSLFPGALGKMVMKVGAGFKLMTSYLLATAAASSTMGRGITGSLGRMGTAIAANAAKIGAIGVGIAALATIGFLVFRTMTADARKFREENDKIAQSVKGWAKVYDFTLLERGQKRNEETGEAEDTPQSRIMAMKDDEYMGALVDRLERQKDDEKKIRNELYSEAVKLASQGIKPEDIKRNLDELMSAANIDQTIKAKMNIEFNDFNVTGPDGSPLADAAGSKIDELMNSRDGNTLSKMQQLDYTSFSSAFGGGRDKSELSQAALGDLNNFFTDMDTALATASADPAMFDKAVDQWFGKLDETFKRGLADFGPDIEKAINENGGLLNADLSALAIDMNSPISKMSGEEYDKLAYRQQLLIKSTERLKEEYGGMDEMYATSAGAAVAAANSMDMVINTPQEAAKQLKDQIASLGPEWDKLSKDQKAQIINAFRASAGYSNLEGSMLDAAIAAGVLGGKGKQSAEEIAAVGDEALAAQNALDDVEVNWDAEFTIHMQQDGTLSTDQLEKTMKLSDYKDAMGTVQGDMFDYAATASKDILSARLDDLKSQQDAAGKELDAEGKRIEDDFKGRSKALDDRQKQEEKVFSKSQDAEKKMFDKNWENRMDAEAKIYDDRVKAIEAAQEAEDDLERQRQRNTEREAARLRYLASMMNNNIDMNIAIASGDLDQASRLSINAGQETIDMATQDSDREAGYKKEDDDRGRKTAIDLINDEKEARMEMLEDQKELEREAMEERMEIAKEEFDRKRELEREALDNSRQAAMDNLTMRREAMQQEYSNKQVAEQAMQQLNATRMQQELDTLRAFIPRTQAEMMAQKDAIQAVYAKYGIDLQFQGDQWSQFIRDSMTNRLEEARIKMSNEAAWNDFGRRVAGGVSQGALNMNVDDFNKFIRTGDMPGQAAPRTQGSTGFGGTRHEGGPIMARGGYDKYDSRAGIPKNAPLRSDETTVLAQKGEYVIKRDMHKKLGTSFLDKLNKGRFTRHDGGPLGEEHTGAIGAVRHDGGPTDGIGVLNGLLTAGMIGGVISRVALATGTAMSDAINQGAMGQYIGEGAAAAAMAFAKSQHGLPYQYGGAGNPSWDCSSYMSGIYNILTGKGDPKSRSFNTETFRNGGGAAMGFRPGFDPDFPNGFTVGLHHGPGGGANSHMAGTLLGTSVESDGSRGVQFGGSSQGAKDPYFHEHWYLPGVSGRKKEEAKPGGFNPTYAGWSTEGIDKYRQKAMQQFAPMTGGAAVGDFMSGNSEFYAKEIVDEAKRRGLTKKAAVAALMTVMQESSMRMLANHAVPESFNFPHDGVGGDHDSIGLFQQRSAGWGSVAQRMNARGSSGMFYNKLAQFDYNNMDEAVSAQKVQVSAYPGAYSKWRAPAEGFANRLFDDGGLAFGTGFMPKNVVAPERVLSPAMTQSFDNKLIPILQSLSGNKGITGYDKIVQALKNDNGQIAGLASKVVNEASKAAKDTVKEYNISLTIDGNVYGVDDLESKLTELTDAAIKKIEEAEITRRRRLTGR